MALVISVLEQGMIYAIMALGMYITYKNSILDMTVDGSFSGAAISTVLISNGVNAYLHTNQFPGRLRGT